MGSHPTGPGQAERSRALKSPLPTHSWTGPLPQHFLPPPFGQSQGSSRQASRRLVAGFRSSQPTSTSLMVIFVHFLCHKCQLNSVLGILSGFRSLVGPDASQKESSGPVWVSERSLLYVLLVPAWLFSKALSFLPQSKNTQMAEWCVCPVIDW